jgi:hypothetical protein
MKAEEVADGTLVVSHDGSPLAKFMLGFMLLFLGTAGYDALFGTRGAERLIGLLGASATCLVVAIAFHETARFEFSRPTHLVTWRRRRGFRERSGTMPFGGIQSVMVERPLGDEGTPSRRINLRTVDGAEIPLTVGYQTDSDGAILKTADQIRALLGHKAEELRSSDQRHLADVSTLVAAGRMIEAIKVMREAEGISLTDAKQLVDQLHRQSAARHPRNQRKE